MDREHFDQTMTVLKERRPFQPFTIALVNGDRFEVYHPGALAVRDGLGMFAGPGGVPFIFDNEGVCQIEGDLNETGAD